MLPFEATEASMQLRFLAELERNGVGSACAVSGVCPSLLRSWMLTPGFPELVGDRAEEVRRVMFLAPRPVESS